MRAKHLMLASIVAAILAAISLSHFALPAILAALSAGLGAAAYFRQRRENCRWKQDVKEAVTVKAVEGYRELMACRAVLNDLPDVFLMAQGDGKVLETSRNTGRLLGRSLEGQDLQALTGVPLGALQDGEKRPCEFSLNRADGSTAQCTGEAARVDSADSHYYYIRAQPVRHVGAR